MQFLTCPIPVMLGTPVLLKGIQVGHVSVCESRGYYVEITDEKAIKSIEKGIVEVELVVSIKTKGKYIDSYK